MNFFEPSDYEKVCCIAEQPPYKKTWKKNRKLKRKLNCISDAFKCEKLNIFLYSIGDLIKFFQKIPKMFGSSHLKARKIRFNFFKPFLVRRFHWNRFSTNKDFMPSCVQICTALDDFTERTLPKNLVWQVSRKNPLKRFHCSKFSNHDRTPVFHRNFCFISLPFPWSIFPA